MAKIRLVWRRPGHVVKVPHPGGLTRPFLEIAFDWLESDDLPGAFTAETGPTLGFYTFTFSNARTAMAFKLRWG